MMQAWISSISTISVGCVVIASSATWNGFFVVTKAVTIWNASMWTIVTAAKSFEWSSTIIGNKIVSIVFQTEIIFTTHLHAP